uniref:DUF4347 domain-containing protein n=1 Tax=Psychromonas sp. TaxID=1884585 RepID=UPI0035664008
MKKSASAKKYKHASPVIEGLEPRILLSADLPGLDLLPDDFGQQGDIATDDILSDAQAEFTRLDTQFAAVDDADISNTTQEEDTPDPLLQSADLQADVRYELLVIDAGVEDYSLLVESLQAQAGDDTILEVLILDSNRNGIEQLSEILADRQDLDALHLISHGSSGSLQIGNSQITQVELAQNSQVISGWANAFSADADLLIYGCDLAADAQGELFIDTLATLTATDVAASDDLTGSAGLGGDWELEYQSGDIESGEFFSNVDLNDWQHLLDAAVDNTSSGTSIADNLTISHTTSGTDRLMLVGVSLNKGAGSAVTSITYNGDALTLVGSSSNGDAVAEIWQLVNPDLGTYDVNILLNGKTDGNAAGVMTFTGVDQTSALGVFGSASGGSGGSASATISSASEELVFGIIAVDEDSNYDLAPGADQTEDWDLYPGKGINAGGSTKAGADDVELSWGWSGSDNWAAAGVSIKPSSNSAPVAVDDEIISASEDTLFTSTVDLHFNDTDPDGDSLTVVAGTFATTQGGSLELAADGSYTYMPAGNFTGTDSVDYTVTDGSLSDTGMLTITVNAVNDAPVIDLDLDDSSGSTGADYQTTYVEGNAPVIIVDNDVSLVDVDSSNLNSILVTLINQIDGANKETLSADTSGTSLNVTWDRAATATTGVLTIDGSGTIADYLSVLSSVTYENTSNNPNTIDRVITFVANDGTDESLVATTTVSITSIANGTKAPKAVDDAFTVDEGSINNSLDLAKNDTDGDGDLNISSIAIVSGPSNGSLVVNDDGTVSYTHDGSETTADSFTYKIYDLIGAESNEATVDLTVTPVNDAPVLDASNSPVLTPIDEDAGAPLGAVGSLVSELVDFATPTGQVDNVTDVDSGAGLGIAVTAADTINGVWYFSIDGGTNWNLLGTVSDSNARLLAADASTRLYFQANADYHGTLADAITFRAWDQSSGSNGGVANTSGLTGNFLDNFSAVSYGNNDGSLNWSTDWIEKDKNTTVSDGYFYVSAGKFYTEGHDTGNYAYREVDLSGAVSANLTFSYDNALVNNATIVVEISDDGGATFSALSGLTFDENNNVGVGTASADISAYIAANTQIRFYVAGMETGAGKYDMNVDNVEIAAIGNSGGTSAFSNATDTASLVIIPVADTPSVTSTTTDEDIQSTAGLVISSNTADGAEVSHYKITGISDGTLYKNDGTTQIFDGEFITVAEGNAGLKFTPTSDFNGSGSFTTQASTSDSDAGLGGGTTVANITVDPVNDAPTAANNTIETSEDVDYVFSAADFNFSDVDSGDSLQQVRITALPANGTLQLSGVDIDINQVIEIADIDAGNLVFVPTADENGTGYANFEFEVSDGVSVGATGTVLNSFPTTTPQINSMSGLAFDGTSLWLTSPNDDEIYNYDPAGNLISSFASPGTFPTGITFDGTNLWVVDRDANMVYEIDTLGNMQSSFATPGTDSRGLTWDGSSLWLVEGSGSLIYKLSTTGAVESSFAWPDDDYMRDITWDGSSLWVADGNDQQIIQIDTDGTFISSFTSPSTHATGLTFDGIEFWHADADTDIIYQLAGSNSVGYSASAYTMTIDVTAVNDAPVITSPSGTYSYTENAGAVVLGGSATLSDSDSADFNGGQLVYQISNNGLAEDRLDIRNQGTAAGQIGVSGLNITYGGTVIGTYNGPSTGVTPLVVDFNSSATVAAVKATINNLSYENTSEDPTASTRTLQAYTTDGDGGTSNTASLKVAVQPVNDAPVISSGGVATAIDENSGAGQVVYTVTATDVDTADTLTYSLSGSDASK